MVINCIDAAWDEQLKKLPIDKQDIYYTSQYYQLEQIHGQGEGQMFVYEKGGNIGVYPFIKRCIVHPNLNTRYYDIETAYGYGGPIAKNDDSLFMKEFEEAFLKYCEKENIIAEFIRFHPLLGNEYFFQRNIQVSHNRKTVWLNLEQDLNDIWMYEISTQNRNTIRKCEKNGLCVKEGTDYTEFVELYNATMKKVGAEDFYFFDQKYYDHFKNNEEYILLNVMQGEMVLAAAVFMKYGEYFHYHLSGSRKEFLKLAPNNILLWAAIKYAKNHGCKKIHFGGGLTDSLEDNLFRFKSRFSSTYADFYIGKRIHDKEVYNMLIADWEQKHNKKAIKLLQYREWE